MEISTVLFDLDGTITDSGSGIINSVKYALKKAGRKIPPEDELRKFIGPPLQEQFMRQQRWWYYTGNTIRKKEFLITGSMMESWKC